MNKDYKRRDEIVFGDYQPDRYKFGGCANTEIYYDQLKQLVDEDFIELNECQNDSPSTEEFLDSVAGYEENAVFQIYTISHEREDYRVTIEGISVTVPKTDIDAFINFVQYYRFADEFDVDCDDENFYIRAWWD